MRREERGYKSKNNQKKILYLIGGCITIALVTFVISCLIYGKSEKEISDDSILGISDSENSTKTVVSEMGNKVKENEVVNNSKNEISNNIVKDITNENKENNVQVVEIKQKEKSKKQDVNIENKQDENSIEEKEKEEVVELHFSKPVEGDVIKTFAKDNLIYSETLKEWTTHDGIDIRANKTTVVKSSEVGIVKSIKSDPRFGLTIIVEHPNGFKTVYANLLSTEFVVENESVDKGQSLGTVGNTASFEISEPTHLHFEMLKDGEEVDPMLYIEE